VVFGAVAFLCGIKTGQGGVMNAFTMAEQRVGRLDLTVNAAQLCPGGVTGATGFRTVMLGRASYWPKARNPSKWEVANGNAGSLMAPPAVLERTGGALLYRSALGASALTYG
jgi:hypothetical protein